MSAVGSRLGRTTWPSVKRWAVGVNVSGCSGQKGSIPDEQRLPAQLRPCEGTLDVWCEGLSRFRQRTGHTTASTEISKMTNATIRLV